MLTTSFKLKFLPCLYFFVIFLYTYNVYYVIIFVIAKKSNRNRNAFIVLLLTEPIVFTLGFFIWSGFAR